MNNNDIKHSDWTRERTQRLREFFGLKEQSTLLPNGATAKLDVDSAAANQLAAFNIEWHVVPSNEAVPLDGAYLAKLYPRAPRNFSLAREYAASYRDIISDNHKQHQGHIIGVETTIKPRYLPGNRQYYGTPYGFDATLDPLSPYMGRAGLMSGTRYAHDYLSLQQLLRVVADDWQARSMMPSGYRLSLCPPGIFNLIGTIFHPEWSETESLELGFYTDARGNAECFAVGSNAPGDFSFINAVEGAEDWRLLGFRLALVPE